MSKTMERPKIIVQAVYTGGADMRECFGFPVSPRGAERNLFCPYL